MQKILIASFSLVILSTQSFSKTYASNDEGQKAAIKHIHKFADTVKENNLEKFREHNSGDVVLLTYTTSLALREKEITDTPSRAGDNFKYGLKNIRFTNEKEKLKTLSSYLDLNGRNWKSKVKFRYNGEKSNAFKIADSKNGKFYQKGSWHKFEILIKRSHNADYNTKGWIVIGDNASLQSGTLERSFSVKNIVIFH